MGIITALLLIIIILFLVAIYRKLYWILIETRKTDSEKEIEHKNELREREHAIFRLTQKFKDINNKKL